MKPFHRLGQSSPLTKGTAILRNSTSQLQQAPRPTDESQMGSENPLKLPVFNQLLATRK